MKKKNPLKISAVKPALGVPGGVVSIECQGFEPGFPGRSTVLLGEIPAEIMSASSDRILVRLPDSPSTLGISLRVGDAVSAVFPFSLATRLATDLHPVTSPVIAPDGTVVTTISGSRGETTAQPLVRVTGRGEKRPFSCEITNPTGLTFSPDGQLFVSSRHDGTVLRYTDYEELEVVADELGVACGLAFDAHGILYVGDRTGKIYSVDVDSGAKKEHAQLEPSISAYHLAMDAFDRLYVTGPTFSMRDSLFRIPRAGEVEVLISGLARPQGMAFMPDGKLLITGAFQGKKGVFRYSPETGTIEHFIAGPILVGIAVSPSAIFLADNQSVLRLEPGGYDNARVS
jgi:sugar lactone lactonase YvrE